MRVSVYAWISSPRVALKTFSALPDCELSWSQNKWFYHLLCDIIKDLSILDALQPWHRKSVLLALITRLVWFSFPRQDKDPCPWKVLLATARDDWVGCGQWHTWQWNDKKIKFLTLWSDTVTAVYDKKKKIFSSIHLTRMFISCVRKLKQLPSFISFQLSCTFYAFLSVEHFWAIVVDF